MNQEIRFKGLSLAGDDHTAQPGELSLCAAVEVHDGALRPSVLNGTEACNIRGTLIYVHRTQTFTNYIARLDNPAPGSAPGLTFFPNKDGEEELFAVFYTHDPESEYPGFLSSDIRSIQSVGNTLIVMTDEGLNYFLFQPAEGKYKYIGNKIPFLNFNFCPSENVKAEYSFEDVNAHDDIDQTETFETWREFNDREPADYLDTDGETIIWHDTVPIKQDRRSEVTETVWACINKANDLIARSGHFYAPYLVRYCYTLYDGSRILHSSPALMQVSLPYGFRVYSPNVLARNVVEYNDQYGNPVTLANIYLVRDANIYHAATGDTWPDDAAGLSGKTVRVRDFTAAYAPQHTKLLYRLPSAERDKLTILRAYWSDIVKSVEVYVTPPVIRERTDSLIEQMKTDPGSYGVVNRELTGNDGTIYRLGSPVLGRRMTEVGGAAGRYFAPTPSDDYTGPYPAFTSSVIFDIPSLDADEYAEKIRQEGSFYRVKVFSLDHDFPDVYTDIGIPEGILNNLAVQPMLIDESHADDYKTHNTVVPAGNGGGMYTYNGRVNVYGCQERLFEGFPYDVLTNPCNYPGPGCPDSFKGINIWQIMVEIKTEEGSKSVQAYPDTALHFASSDWVICNSPLFYPDSRASAMTIYYKRQGDDTLYARTFRMEPHPLLNGATTVFTLGEDSFPTDSPAPSPLPAVDDSAPLLNKIYLSAANNPYYFPPEGIVTVGIGQIIGVAATTRALSQGQFGQYPLMAFTSDGIWSLAVSSTGTYSSVHPITREVCVNPASICQLDQSVLFATDRSLSRIAESSTVSISGILDGPVQSPADLPRLAELFAPGGPYADEAIPALLTFSDHPTDYFRTGTPIYDFANSRIIILPPPPPSPTVPPSVTPAYVFSIRDESWSTMLVPPLRAALNSYPYPYVQDTDGTISILDKPYRYTADDTTHTGIVITRPLSYADTMQAIQSFVQHSTAAQTQLIIIYGSNDLRRWHYIGRSMRSHASYLAAHSFRYFRIAVRTSLSLSEKYSSVTLGIIEKYRKL